MIIKFPLLFADEDSLVAISHCIDLLIEHEFQLISFTLLCHYLVLSLLLLYEWVLFTFCDMIIIFVNDYGKIDSVLRMILNWIIMSNFSSLLALVWLCILIIISDVSDITFMYDVLETKALCHNLHQLDSQSHINAFSLILLFFLFSVKFLSDVQH